MAAFWQTAHHHLRVLANMLDNLAGKIPLVGSARRRSRRAQAFTWYAPSLVTIGPTSAQIYPEGLTLAHDMLAAIAQARETIMFETFLWQDDISGERFKRALIERARAGVQVYIIYDRLASLPYASWKFKRFPALPALHVLPYRSVRAVWHLFDPRRYGRDHRKLLVVDGRTAFVGGYNISDRWLAWRDTHLRLEGPAASKLTASFVSFWNQERGSRPVIAKPPEAESPGIQVFCNDRTQLAFPIRRRYVDAIERAQKRILITQAYFVPDRQLLAALMCAAERGVDVLILFPWRSEHATADWLCRRRFGRCLRSGIRLFGYHGPILHAKTATIDGEWTTIGTANLDRLSLAGNNEINVELFDRALGHEMEAVFAGDLASAREVRLEQWSRRSWRQRLGEALIAPFWPLV